MNKIKVWLIAMIAVPLLTSTASAALFNPKNGTPSESASWSLENMYSSMQSLALEGSTSRAAIDTVQQAFILESGSHITPKVKQVPKRTYKVSVSAYSSTVDQTDSTPFITASGTYVRDGIVAANFLPIGTAIKIPSLFGDKIFIVEDRMNSRYWYNVDIWFSARETAKQFGRKTTVIEIVS